MSFALFVLAAAQSSEPARTVNDGELGPADRFTTHGPATICLRELVVRPAAGQSVQLTYLGIHFGSVQLNLADDEQIEFTHGDNFRDHRDRGQSPSWRQKRMGFYRVADEDGAVRYQIEGRGIRTEYDARPRVMVTGAKLAGNRSDKKQFDMVSFEDPDSVECDVRYEYGWGMLLGDTPLETKNDDAGDSEEN